MHLFGTIFSSRLLSKQVSPHTRHFTSPGTQTINQKFFILQAEKKSHKNKHLSAWLGGTQTFSLKPHKYSIQSYVEISQLINRPPFWVQMAAKLQGYTVFMGPGYLAKNMANAQWRKKILNFPDSSFKVEPDHTHLHISSLLQSLASCIPTHIKVEKVKQCYSCSRVFKRCCTEQVKLSDRS